MIERHYHWKFLAWNGVPTGDRADVNAWATSVEVIGYLSEADARIAAQEMVTRESWHLHAVFECGACGFQRQVGQAMNTIAGKS